VRIALSVRPLVVCRIIYLETNVVRCRVYRRVGVQIACLVYYGMSYRAAYIRGKLDIFRKRNVKALLFAVEREIDNFAGSVTFYGGYVIGVIGYSRNRNGNKLLRNLQRKSFSRPIRAASRIPYEVVSNREGKAVRSSFLRRSL